jgi:hypothetical protein
MWILGCGSSCLSAVSLCFHGIAAKKSSHFQHLQLSVSIIFADGIEPFTDGHFWFDDNINKTASVV